MAKITPLTEKEEKIIADNIEKELEDMNGTLSARGHCSTIAPERIHKLRTDIYDYIQKVTGSTNPRHIAETELAVKLKTIETKLILGCYAKERELTLKLSEK